MSAIPNYPITTLTSCVREAYGLVTELRGLIDTVQSRSNAEAPARLLRLDEVLARTGERKSKLYQRIHDGEFPAQLHVGRSARWDDRKVTAWIEAKALAAHHSNKQEAKS